MNNYWANFEIINNDIFRYNTRVYLNLVKTPSDHDLCIGAIVGKNPGSALPKGPISGGLQEIELSGDKLLPNLRNIILKAYDHANKQVPMNAYIQVLNLFYLCDKSLTNAIKSINGYPNTKICTSERKEFPFLWYVWGSEDKRLNLFKERFTKLSVEERLYVDTDSKVVINTAPGFKNKAKHIQGLEHNIVIPFISKLI